LALPPQGMRFSVIDVAAPGRSAHHPGITLEGVISGDRDNSSIGRNLREAGPRLPASTLIRTLDAAPGDHRARRHQLGRQALLPWQVRPTMEPGSFSRTEGSADAGQDPVVSRKCAHASVRHTSDQQHRAPGSPGEASCAATAPSGNLRVLHRGPLLEQAGLAESWRESPPAPAARQRLKPSEQDGALHPGPGGLGTATGRRWDGHTVFGSYEIVPPGELGRRAPREQAPRGSPCRGWSVG